MTFAEGYPDGFLSLTVDQRNAYVAEQAAMKVTEDKLGRARRADDDRVEGCLPSTGRECSRCKKAAVTVNDDGRCDFCAATFVMAFGTGWERAQFILRGELAVL